MTDDLTAILRRRLHFRSQRRGSKELDLIFGAFAAAHLDSLNPEQLARYDALLDVEDPVIHGWLVRGEPAIGHDNDIMALLRRIATGP
ncbi:MAG: succinate dehydrogenase assembly factor 2 [Alphaproteobacteria bacterium]|nr:succinate dehydrogenase assembly factor 2 [Alphaproteobacteria bacterium]